MCKYCRAQPATEGLYCNNCLLERAHEMLKDDVIAACQEEVISQEECLFIIGPTAAALTRADLERFDEIMRNVDGCRSQSERVSKLERFRWLKGKRQGAERKAPRINGPEEAEHATYKEAGRNVSSTPSTKTNGNQRNDR